MLQLSWNSSGNLEHFVLVCCKDYIGRGRLGPEGFLSIHNGNKGRWFKSWLFLFLLSTFLCMQVMYLRFMKNILLFFYTHLGYPLDFIFVFHRHVMGGIPPPSRSIVGKNRSTQGKSTVRSKKEVSPRVRRGPHYLFPSVNFLFYFYLH